MAVSHLVCQTDRIVLLIAENEGGSHVPRTVPYLHFCPDELHGYIVAVVIDGDSRILADLAVDTVQETFIQPFP